MRKTSLIKTLPIPAGIRGLFDDPPLLASEDPQAFWSLLSAIADDVKPDGPIEWLLLKDFVWYTWEIWRLRAFKRRIIEMERAERADDHATWAYRQKRMAEDPDLDEFDLQRETIDPQTLRQLTPKLDTEEDSVLAFRESINELERLDQQLASHERRRDNSLREIELRREILARRLREVSAKLIEEKRFPASLAAE